MKIFSKNINIVAYARYLVMRKLYYRAYMSDPAWAIMNRDARALYRKYPVGLLNVQKRIVDDMRESGFAIAQVSELFGDESYVQTLRAYADALRLSPLNADQNKSKSHLMYLLGVHPILDPKSPVAQFARERVILDVMNAYMGMATKFHSVELNVTRPVGDASAIASQRWHRDCDDKKICRAFVYLSDVDERSGPFIYIKGSHGIGKWGSLYRQDPPAGSYPPQGAVERLVSSDDIRVCTGKAGTIVFADTAGLHKGGYATHNERYMMTVGYNAGRTSLTSENFIFSEAVISDGFDAIQRHAFHG